MPTHQHINDNYEDIIEMPHHVSETRPQMSLEARAAQFAPFAALTGFDEAIEEVVDRSVVSS